jgi:hypothetical protein
MCSPEFLDIYKAAPLVIAKGQANYESLSSAGSKAFCLLQIKVSGDFKGYRCTCWWNRYPTKHIKLGFNGRISLALS